MIGHSGCKISQHSSDAYLIHAVHRHRCHQVTPSLRAALSRPLLLWPRSSVASLLDGRHPSKRLQHRHNKQCFLKMVDSRDTHLCRQGPACAINWLVRIVASMRCPTCTLDPYMSCIIKLYSRCPHVGWISGPISSSERARTDLGSKYIQNGRFHKPLVDGGV